MKRTILKRICAWSLAVAMCMGNEIPAAAVGQDENSIGAGTDVVLMTSDGMDNAEDIAIDETNFPDEKFRNYIKEQIDGKMLEGDTQDNVLSAEEIAKVENICVTGMDIENLEGINFFTDLLTLYCDENQLTTLDVSGLDQLWILECQENQLTSLNVSGLTKLEILYCNSNQLTSLNLNGLTGLKNLNCKSNKLTSLDISSLPSLERLVCPYNELKTLNTGIEPLPNLTYFDCSENQFQNLDVSKLTGLTYLDCSTNYLYALDVSALTSLVTLYCDNNLDMRTLNVTGLNFLYLLKCEYNSLTSLDVSGLTNLTYLYCKFNDLTDLDVSNLANLSVLDCSYGSISNLKLENMTNLFKLECSSCKLNTLDLSSVPNLTELECSFNQLTELNLTNLTELKKLNCTRNKLTGLDVAELTNLQCLYSDDILLSGLDLREDTKLESVQIYIYHTRQYNLSNIQGLDLTKIEASSGTISESMLTLDEDEELAELTYKLIEDSSSEDDTIQFSIIYSEGDDSGEDNKPDENEHHYSDTWTVDVAPTCTQKGSKSHHCTDDNCDSRTDVTEIQAYGHMFTVQTTPATMAKNGSIVKKCSVCGAMEDTQVVNRIDSVTLSKTSSTYNSKVQKPKVTVKDSKGVTLSADCYDVKYSSGFKAVGVYTVKVVFKGKYSGNTILTYTIAPKATSISNVTAKKKGFALKWKKVTTQTAGYEIWYSTSKNFKKAGKTIVKKNKSIEKTISKLKAKKTYYVRIRTYNTVKVNGKSQKIYSGWSKVKTVKTKK